MFACIPVKWQVMWNVTTDACYDVFLCILNHNDLVPSFLDFSDRHASGRTIEAADNTETISCRSSKYTADSNSIIKAGSESK